MWLLWLFDTTGLIVGPLIVLAGLVAVGYCLRASRPGAGPDRRRRAFAAALVPATVGVAGALAGLVVWWADGANGDPSAVLGKVCLAGAAVTALPLAWATLLSRAEPRPA